MKKLLIALLAGAWLCFAGCSGNTEEDPFARTTKDATESTTESTTESATESTTENVSESATESATDAAPAETGDPYTKAY